MNAVESRINEASDPSIPLHSIEATRLVCTMPLNPMRRVTPRTTASDSLHTVAGCAANHALQLTRRTRFAKPSPIQVVIERVRYLEQHFQVADDSATVTSQLLALMANHPIGGKQVHDANIVATMLTYGIPCLLTHNARDFERFGDMVTVEGIA